MARRDVPKIYDEVVLRAQILEELIRLKVFDYFEVWAAVQRVRKWGLEESIKRLKSAS